MKVIVIMGEPGTGKSTLMRAFMKETGPWKERFDDVKLVPYHVAAFSDWIILGKYEEGEVFAGTDRMSMAVQPEAMKLLTKLANNDYQYSIEAAIFEGDRLTNQSFLEFCIENFDTEIIYLKVPEEERERRYKQRGSDQSETFLKGRVTKYERLRTNFDIKMATVEFPHNTEDDTNTIVKYITSRLT